MAAKRAARGQEATAARKTARGMEIAYVVLAKKLRGAVLKRIAQTESAGPVEELALSLTTAILGPRG